MWGMNTGNGERVRSEGKGPVSGVTGVHRPREPPPSPSTWASNLPNQALPKTPKTGAGGERPWALRNHSLCSEPHSPLQPLLPF